MLVSIQHKLAQVRFQSAFYVLKTNIQSVDRTWQDLFYINAYISLCLFTCVHIISTSKSLQLTYNQHCSKSLQLTSVMYLDRYFMSKYS